MNLQTKVGRNKGFKPEKRSTIAEQVAMKIEEEPSDEELLPQALHFIECHDKDLNDVFNCSAEELMRRPILTLNK